MMSTKRSRRGSAGAEGEGELPDDADPKTLAMIASAALHSLAVRARAGERRRVLEAMAESRCEFGLRIGRAYLERHFLHLHLQEPGQRARQEIMVLALRQAGNGDRADAGRDPARRIGKHPPCAM